MKNFRQMIRTTLIGGVLFLIPLVIVVAIIGKAIQIMKVVAAPLGKLIPVESFGGFAILQILAIVILFVSCLLVGVLARSAWAKKTREKLDAVLYQLVPGYAVMKGITSGIDDSDREQSLRPVLVRLDDQLQVAFEVERIADGFVAVFFPGSPDPLSGTVSYVTSDRVKPIDVGFNAVLKIQKHRGIGSAEILSGQLA